MIPKLYQLSTVDFTSWYGCWHRQRRTKGLCTKMNYPLNKLQEFLVQVHAKMDRFYNSNWFFFLNHCQVLASPNYMMGDGVVQRWTILWTSFKKFLVQVHAKMDRFYNSNWFFFLNHCQVLASPNYMIGDGVGTMINQRTLNHSGLSFEQVD